MNSRLEILVGDITQSDSDAIVNAANPTLLGGSGRTEPSTKPPGRSCWRSAGSSTAASGARPKLTREYHLKAQYVLHTPGPIWRGGDKGEAETLASCYRSCLELAAQHGLGDRGLPLHLHRRLWLSPAPGSHRGIAHHYGLLGHPSPAPPSADDLPQ